MVEISFEQRHKLSSFTLNCHKQLQQWAWSRWLQTHTWTEQLSTYKALVVTRGRCRCVWMSLARSATRSRTRSARRSRTRSAARSRGRPASRWPFIISALYRHCNHLLPLKVHKKVPVKATKKIPKQRCVHTDGYQEPGQPQVLGKLGSLLHQLKHKLLKHVTNKMKSVKVKTLQRQSS